VRAVMKKGKLKPADVKGIGLSGQMHGSVFLDKQNRVIRRALLWNDQRTTAECAEIEERAGGRKKLIKMVANPALTGFTAPKILWLRNNEPKNFDKLAKVLLPKGRNPPPADRRVRHGSERRQGMLLSTWRNESGQSSCSRSSNSMKACSAKCYESEEVTGTLTTAAPPKSLGSRPIAKSSAAPAIARPEPSATAL
jgi:xylulokinase